MLPLIPHEFRVFGQYRARPITERDLVRAHASSGAFASTLRETGPVLSSRVGDLVVAGAWPLLAHFVLHWPFPLLVLLLLIDNAAGMVADVVRRLCAPHHTDLASKLVHEIDAALEIADALANPLRARRPTVESSGRPVLARNVEEPEGSGLRAIYVVAMVSIATIVGPLLFAFAAVQNVAGVELGPGGWAVISLPFFVRPLHAFWQCRRAWGEGGFQPNMYPRGSERLAVFMLAVLVYILLAAIGHAFDRGVADRHAALFGLSSLFAVATAVGVAGMIRARRGARRLASFAAQDRDSLRARLHLYNGTTT